MRDLDQTVRRWGMWCHLAALAWLPLLIILPLPFLGGVVVTYVLWQNKKDLHPFIDEQGKSSLNFQISLTLYMVVAVILVGFLLLLTCGIALTQNSSAVFNWLSLPLFATAAAVFLLIVTQIVLVISAALKAYNGQSYRYPWAQRFLT